MNELVMSLQAVVAASIFFVWVVRYDNIIKEFQEYGLPDWLRDLVGILKLSFALMLVIGIGRAELAVVGGVGIAALMACAFATHVRSKTAWPRRLPSMTLLILSLVIAWMNSRAFDSLV